MNDLDKRVYLREIKEDFHLVQVTGDEKSLDRWTIASDINRPGLELAGFTETHGLKRINILGNKECRYINMLVPETARDRFEFITDAYTPCIIMSDNNKPHPLLVEVANSKNFPVFLSELPTYALVSDLITYLDEKLAKEELILGELIQVKGVGVLLQGASGMGKSEIAMELVKRGSYLVADDTVIVKKYHNRLFGEAPEITKGLLEVRGIGVIDVQQMFGAAASLDFSGIHLVIKLVKHKEGTDVERIGGDVLPTIAIMGIELPYIELPVFEGRSTTEVVEAAVLNYRLMKKGVNTAMQFKQNIIDNLKGGIG